MTRSPGEEPGGAGGDPYRAFADTVIAAAVILSTTIVGAALAGVPVGILRAPAALVLVFLAPGYGVLQVVRGRSGSAPPLVLAIPLSLATVVVGGAVLAATPLGVRPAALAGALCALTAALLVAARQQLRDAADDAVTDAPALLSRLTRAAAPPVRVALVLILALVSVWSAHAIMDAARPRAASYVALEATLTHVEADGGSGVLATIEVSVENRSGDPLHGVLRLRGASPPRALREVDVDMPARQVWRRAFRVRSACGQRLHADLVRARTPDEGFRRVAVAVNCGD